MDSNPPDLFRMVEDQFRRLWLERERLLASVADVDRRIYQAATALGLDPSSVRPPTQREAHQPVPGRRGRSREGTMTGFVLDLIKATEAGLTRRELATAIADSEFAEQHRKNPNSLYNLIVRALDRGEIKDTGGKLHDPSRQLAAAPSTFTATPGAQSPGDPKNWPELVSILLRDQEHGQTTAELRERIQGTEWATKLQRQPTILWSALSRQKSKGLVRQHGERWFDAGIYARILAGEIDHQLEPEPGEQRRIPEVITSVLMESGAPLTGREIFHKIRDIPEVAPRIGALGELVYTHLSKMYRRGDLTKVNSQYDLPGRQHGAGNVVPLASKNGGQR